jgi:glyoxylase-like metal-dependent hydrolase (beta-lactamase superfamily II)
VQPTTSADWCRGPRSAVFSTLERVPTQQDWFEVYRVRPDTFAIYEPKQYELVISYLIVGEERALLFDSGLGIGHMSTLVRELSSKPVTVLNSHTHFDHVGGNAEFDDVWNTDTPFSRASARGELDDYGRAALEPDRLCGQLPTDLAPGPYALRPWRVTHRIRDGERIDLGGRVLEVIFTPGHSPDSLVLLDRAHGLLFTGDTYYPGPIYLFARGTDLDAYARSVARLAGLVPELERLLPAHEVPGAEPAQLLALERAVEQVRAGTIEPVPTDDTLEYRFDGFSLLLAR